MSPKDRGGERKRSNLSICHIVSSLSGLHVLEPLYKQALGSQRAWGKWEFTKALLYKVSGMALIEFILQMAVTHRPLDTTVVYFIVIKNGPTAQHPSTD